MRKLKHKVTYGSFVEVLGKFPRLLTEHRLVLEDVKKAAVEDLARPATEVATEDWGLIHGDFWTGNTLLSRTPSPETSQPRVIPDLFIIDWEFAQFGHRAHDLGKMVGDLVEINHYYSHASGAMPAIQGFADGYGGLNDDIAFRTAIHAGVHLIGGYHRRSPSGSMSGHLDQVEGAMMMGRDFVVKGWQRDKKWFEDSVLSSLFGWSKGNKIGQNP